MLDSLRNAGRSWVAKVLIGVLILAVAGFGIPSVFLDLNANTVARVGDQNVTARDFDRLYRSQLNQFAAQTGQSLTAQQALAFGVPGSVLGQLANDAAIETLAQRLDLGASDERLAAFVRRDPSFAGALGAFDRSEFVAVLRQAGYTESEYLNLQRRAAKREQVGAIFDGLALPQTAFDIARAYENERRVIEFIELNPVLFAVIDEPSEEELAQFFEENQNRFRTEETRRVRVLPLTAETLAAGIEVSDTEIEAEYERTSSQYQTVERRSVHQLVLANEEIETIFTQGLADGVSFEDLVAEAGAEGRVQALGTLQQSQMTDTSLANAAFGLEEGEFAIISGAQGPRAIWVSEIIEGGVQPLDEVRDAIERSLATSRAQGLLLDAFDAIDEARAAFQPIDDVAAHFGLAIYELDLTRSGDALAEIDAIPADARSNVTQQIFDASETANITPAINLGSNRTVFFEIENVQPVRDQTLDEVRDEAIAAWQELQSELSMIAAAEDMVASLDSGADMFMTASQAGQIPQVSQAFSRDGSGDATIGADVARAAFMGTVGAAGYAPIASGEVVVFQVTEVMEADADAQSNIAAALSANFPDQMFGSFVEGLREDTPIRINESTLNRLIGLE
ncbi:SurA N-terminal domain-containing protein [Pelagibacterium lentulum]|uniref:Peptidyl-prolyl cis-trans isomerase n=1 Tax=Pelagibacterium lentulum TaxID=2029865 RepID=A0A916RFP4_9HYPH|nr:SurA N-terminal domain-containing protein [Pelagibacterium lentulum]GGA52536.1 peptidyl-prolyl cis-trans isomerase [Pelagibacterium lentulum]